MRNKYTFVLFLHSFRVRRCWTTHWNLFEQWRDQGTLKSGNRHKSLTRSSFPSPLPGVLTVTCFRVPRTTMSSVFPVDRTPRSLSHRTPDVRLCVCPEVRRLRGTGHLRLRLVYRVFSSSSRLHHPVLIHLRVSDGGSILYPSIEGRQREVCESW